MSIRTARWLPLCVFLLVAACGGDGDTDGDDAGDTGSDATEMDVGADVVEDTEPDLGGRDVVDVVEDVLTPNQLYCLACDIAADCGPGAFCLEGYPGEQSFCSADCTDDADICPGATTCTDIAEGGLQRACVPNDLLACPCLGVECEGDQICDPFSAACIDPLGLCEECEGSEQCGEGNFCLEFRVEGGRIERGCATDCSASTCPDGYECGTVNLGADQTAQLCIPEIRTCTDRCVDVTCENLGDYCDPLTGDCIEPGEMCAPCGADYQCGGLEDRCLGLQGGPCETDNDCGRGEDCNADGVCISAHCGLACDPDSADLEQCPAEAACFLVDAATREGQCLPLRLDCNDRCDGVTCPAGENCDDLTGECVESLVGICSAECPSNAECGAYDDLCINIGNGTRCLYGCGDEVGPCPLGYDCLELFSSLSFCVPQNGTGECFDCVDTACPDGEECLPVDASCHPEPTACSPEDTTCPEGELCSQFEGRCEPIGLPCTWDNRFQNCDFSTMACTVGSPALLGTCEEVCFSDVSCPDDRPFCRSYHNALSRVCTADADGGAHTCGRLADSTVPFGEPCAVVDDPTDPAICPSSSTTLCLEGVDPAVPGICTRECVEDADCPGARCAAVGDARYCLPEPCECLSGPVLAEGEVDELAELLIAQGGSRCAVAWPTVLRRTAYALTDIEDHYRAPIVSPLVGSPLDASAALRIEQDAVLGAVGVGAQLTAALDVAFRSWDVQPRNALSYDPPLADGVLAQTIDEVLLEVGGAPLDTATTEALGAIDDSLEVDLARIILHLRDVALMQRDSVAPAIAGTLTGDWPLVAQTWFPGASFTPWDDDELRLLLGNRGVRERIATLAVEAAALVEAVQPLGERGGLAGTITIPTDIGAIVFAGTDADDHAFATPPALLVDLGGDDTYTGQLGANAGIDQPASIVVDLGGADTWGYVAVPVDEDEGFLPSDGQGRAEAVALGDGPVSLSTGARQGAGLMGVGAVIDLGAGRDQFVSLRFSQGFGLLGVGLLVDEAGDVDLVLEAGGQGAGMGGIGALVLGDGVADVQGVHAAQGFGAPGGVGILIGGTGASSYRLDPALDGDILYFDAETRGSDSSSLGLGAGAGIAPDEGQPGVSGGVGVVIERGGDDTYEAGIGAIGAGFWHGAGFFLDASGADTYRVSGFALGAGERLGVGAFEDRDGDDRYGDRATERFARAVAGSGRDMGVGSFIDRAGADTHAHSFRSMGFGQFNGFGLFFDADGDDVYYADANESMGQAVLTIAGSEPRTNPRRDIATFGIFLDTGGRDTYERPDLLNPPIGDDLSWQQTSRDEEAYPTYGGGFDGVGGTGL